MLSKLKIQSLLRSQMYGNKMQIGNIIVLKNTNRQNICYFVKRNSCQIVMIMGI